ncbi:CocE/NonD family hydrolase [Prauserella cavernicola]|uniref:CocE/NonD family hydrolase n=1 Tax=Prauserella cavernicola TaxID=2800127 RepID=A0A934V809_9PSEU|nr:CocE/NonD family hydrolase [Prauserella cavernicola]MBK1787810.1 CocE/NonD family hydrolase [Prauserella cavernicola]
MKKTRVAASAAAAVALTAALAGCGVAEGADAGAVATADDPVTHAENERVPEGASWTQHYFPSSDGSDVELHADVLLPEGLEEGEQVPVILSTGAYFGHSGQIVDEGWEQTGPSPRFNDFIEGADLMERGYAFVMVDLRGFGGSSGCLDATGAGDQADIKAALDWASSQPWSTGSVGTYGKSFDAITGLMANNLDHDALKAVIAQEPIWDFYRNMRSNGVPRSTIVSVANTYEQIALLPQLPDDDERYRANAEYEKAHPECGLLNRAGYQTADPEAEYWKTRDYASQAKGTDTPLLFTQGTLEWNTEPEGMQEFLENHEGPQRGWIGPWDHKRGNDKAADGRLEMGREGWFEETMSFYDQYLKGEEPTKDYPNFAVQDNTGEWRTQDTWPVQDRSESISLGGGSYVDDGAEPEASPEGSFVKWSEPVGEATRITGTPRVSLNTQGHGNVMVKLHDVAPDGTAVMFDEQVATVGSGEAEFDLKSTDWTLAKGHSLAVEVGTIESGPLSDWIDTPSYQTITVDDAQLELALDNPADDQKVPGEQAVYLDLYKQMYTKQLSVGDPSFTLPPAQG